MIFHPRSIKGVYEIELSPHEDERGRLTRLMNMDDLAVIGHTKTILQVNRSLTRKAGTIRGMHFQYPPMQEIKMIVCLSGSVFDVVVDLRRDSPTFLKWQAFELEAPKNRAVYIPEGCAHGFQTLQDNSELLYFHSAPYSPEHEGGVRYDDRILSIKWPRSVAMVSERDASFQSISSDFAGIKL